MKGIGFLNGDKVMVSQDGLRLLAGNDPRRNEKGIVRGVIKNKSVFIKWPSWEKNDEWPEHYITYAIL